MRVYITESQYDEIERTLSSENMSVFDNTVANRMLDERYDEVVGNFSQKIEDIPSDAIRSKVSKIVSDVKERERRVRPMLEKLCFDTVFSFFGISEEDVSYSCELVDNIDPGMDFRFAPEDNSDTEYDDYETIQSEKLEIEKRKIVNCLICGGATRLMRRSRRSYIDELFEIDEELPHMYSKILAMNEYLLFKEKRKPSAKNHMQSGFVDVRVGDSDGKASLDVKACIFPVLLYESFKGVLEIIASHGLPDDIDSARRVIGASDALEYDPYNMKIGPVLWDLMFSSVETGDITDALFKVVCINAKDFKDLINEVTYRTKKGRDTLNKLFS